MAGRERTRYQLEGSQNGILPIRRVVAVRSIRSPRVDFSIDNGQPVIFNPEVAESVDGRDVR